MVAPNKVVQGRLNLTNNTQTLGRAAPTSPNAAIYVTRLTVQNKHATVATTVQVQSGSTVVHEVNHPAVQTTPVVFDYSQTPIRIAPGQALNFQCGTTGSDVLINWAGFEGI